MTEQDTIQVTYEMAEADFRSHLLMPVMEGHTLDSDDISSFLAVRLAGAGLERDPLPDVRGWTLPY